MPVSNDHDAAPSAGDPVEDNHGKQASGEDEDYEYMKDMMEAMEDGIDDDDDEAEEAPPKEEPDEAPANGPTEEEDEDEEYAMAMMNAMEDGVEGETLANEGDGEEDEEYAMAMMNAMEDGVVEEDGAPQEEDRNPFAHLGQNILQTCSSLTSAVREYYRMSQNDQLQVWDDLTGYQGQNSLEATNTRNAALRELTQELQRMPSSEPHAALDLALEKHPKYVLARTFLLKFLRAEKFDTFATATRMCRHFEIKKELFGEEALGREITLEDFDEDDMDALKSGYLQILQNKDQGQRPVIFYYKAISSCYKERENILRSFWYMANKMSESEEIQKSGVSNIVYNVGGFPRQGMDYEKSRRLSHCFKAIPVRYNNFYVCLDDSPWLTVVETFAVMITRAMRVRLRMIRGTHEEVVEKLKAIGVPVQALPVNSDSELLREAHLEWIEKLRESEKSGIRMEPARNNVPDVVDPSEDYMQMEHHDISDTTASAGGRGPRRRLEVDVVSAESGED